MSDDACMASQSSRSAGKSLTWGVIEDQGQALFAPTGLVEDLCHLRAAMNAATTWGEFREQAPERYLDEIRDALEDQPADTETFDADAIPGFSDGDWPEWLHQHMLDWMPRDLIDRYGSVEDSVLNGQMLEIDAGSGEDVARALEGQGYACTRDDAAVCLAAGWA